MASIEAERDDIQGNILRAYGFPCARYEILRITDAHGARALLARILERDLITTATDWDEQSKPDSALNVFFSWKGLAALGLPAASLDSFPNEFKQGMPSRAALLGDVGPNAPERWEFGGDLDATHVFFALYGRTPDALARVLDLLRAELAAVGPAVEKVHSLDVAHLPDRREHFGYADGIGQPSIEGSGVEEFPGDGTPQAAGWSPLKAGEFVLGWPGETGSCGPIPAPEALGRNGSFLVYRKLQQDVLAFRAFLRAQAQRVFGSDEDQNVERLAAKLVGRWRSGCPIARSPDNDDPVLARDWDRNNDFRYAGDPSGLACPVGSHIRRMNPRDALDHSSDTLVRLHRIIRRGLPYGPPLVGDADDGVERGVAFMAINTSIQFQFEFLQSDWGNSGQFAGLDPVDVDPFSGEPRAKSRFRVPMPDSAPKNLFDLPRFVTMRGGGYFFIPSLTAMRFIAGVTP